MGTKTIASLNYPTPEWAKKTVRALCWITAIYGLLSLTIDLKDFGVPVNVENLILKYMATLTGVVSVVARFIGVKPIDFNTISNDQK